MTGADHARDTRAAVQRLLDKRGDDGLGRHVEDPVVLDQVAQLLNAHDVRGTPPTTTKAARRPPTPSSGLTRSKAKALRES